MSAKKKPVTKRRSQRHSHVAHQRLVPHPRVKKPTLCRLCCSTVVEKKGTLCKPCDVIVTTGKKLVEIGIESRAPHEEIRDMNGFTAYTIAFDPMIKFTNPKSSAPKAISYGNVWFARMDKDHPMHNYLESEWERLGR